MPNNITTTPVLRCYYSPILLTILSNMELVQGAKCTNILGGLASVDLPFALGIQVSNHTWETKKVSLGAFCSRWGSFLHRKVGRTSIQLRPGKFDWVLRAESSSHLASRWLANLVLQLEDTLSSQKKICRETVPSFPWFVRQPQAPPSHSHTAAHQLVLISRVKWKQKNLHHLTSDIYLQMFIFLQHTINSKEAWTPIHQCVFG